MNMKKIISIIFLLTLFFPLISLAAGNPVELYFFEGQGCQHCAKMKSFLEGMKVDYSNLTVHEFEIYFNKENQDLFEKMAKAYGVGSSGVPTIFIGEEVIVGENYEKLKTAVEKCSAETCISPLYKLETSDINNNTNQTTTSGAGQNEVVGWVIIGVIVSFGIGLIIFYFLRR